MKHRKVGSSGVAAALACTVSMVTGNAGAQNGTNLVEFQRGDGRTENYYATGNAALVRGLAEADSYFRNAADSQARDGLDDFVPIEFKRWNNNAAKARMRRFIDAFFGAQSGTTGLVPSAYNTTDNPSGVSNTNKADLRFPFYAGRLLEWADDAATRQKARNLAIGTMRYYTPAVGNGFLTLVDVGSGMAQPADTPILATDWGLGLQGMGALANLLGTADYWRWAAPRIAFAYAQRPNPNVDLLADVYTALTWWAPPGDAGWENRTISDTDTLYLLRLAYEGARLGSDHASMTPLEKVAWQWFHEGWAAEHGQCVRKLKFEDGTAWENRIYSDGKQNYLYTLNNLYRMSGHPAIVNRMHCLWENYVRDSPLDGMVPEAVTDGVGNQVVSQHQALMLDALIDAYQATGSAQLLSYAQTLAANIWGLELPPREFYARPYLRVAESTYGAIGRLEVSFPLASTGGRITIRNALTGVPLTPPVPPLPYDTAVIYVPPGTYALELSTPLQPQPRFVTLDVTSAGVVVNHLIDGATPSSITGYFIKDNNDNGLMDATDTGYSGGTAYLDADNDAIFDTGERNLVIGSSGAFAFVVSPGSHYVRASAAAATNRWTAPSTSIVNGVPGSKVTFLSSGLSVALPAFGLTTKKRVSGFVYNDLNGNGARNSGEPNLTESIVYVDVNFNGQRNLGEPFSATDVNGFYSIGNLVDSTAPLRLVRRSSLPNVTEPAIGRHSLGGSELTVTRTFGVHRGSTPAITEQCNVTWN